MTVFEDAEKLTFFGFFSIFVTSCNKNIYLQILLVSVNEELLEFSINRYYNKIFPARYALPPNQGEDPDSKTGRKKIYSYCLATFGSE
jgi:hypothetical protein